MSVDNPKATGQITANIDIIPNNNAVKACDLFYKTLQSLSLPKKKIKEYEEIGKDVFNIGFYSIVSSKGQGIYRHEKYKRAKAFHSVLRIRLHNLTSFLTILIPGLY